LTPYKVEDVASIAVEEGALASEVVVYFNNGDSYNFVAGDYYAIIGGCEYDYKEVMAMYSPLNESKEPREYSREEALQ